MRRASAPARRVQSSHSAAVTNAPEISGVRVPRRWPERSARGGPRRVARKPRPCALSTSQRLSSGAMSWWRTYGGLPTNSVAPTCGRRRDESRRQARACVAPSHAGDVGPQEQRGERVRLHGDELGVRLRGPSERKSARACARIDDARGGSLGAPNRHRCDDDARRVHSADGARSAAVRSRTTPPPADPRRRGCALARHARARRGSRRTPRQRALRLRPAAHLLCAERQRQPDEPRRVRHARHAGRVGRVRCVKRAVRVRHLTPRGHASLVVDALAGPLTRASLKMRTRSPSTCLSFTSKRQDVERLLERDRALVRAIAGGERVEDVADAHQLRTAAGSPRLEGASGSRCRSGARGASRRWSRRARRSLPQGICERKR